MKVRLNAYAERLDALKPNERALILGAAVVVLAAAWNTVLIEPLDAEKRRLQNLIAQDESKLLRLDEEAVRIVETARRDPNEPLHRQIETAQREIEGFEAEIRDQAGELIDPRDMPQVLQRVLEQTRGLSFVSLEGLGATPLLESGKKSDQKAQNGARTAYRHGFRIRFQGSYLDTIDYLHALEALPWRFFWDAVEVAVRDHPTADASVVVYTLSLDRSWIGV